MPLIIIALLSFLLIFPAIAQVKNLSKITQLSGSGNFTVPSNVYQINVNMCGGGSGGGGVAAGAAASAAGGASGEWVVFNQAVTPGQVIAYSVGVAGPGGVAGNNAGTQGSDTTFGSLVVSGGGGGTGSATGNAAALNQNNLHFRRHLFTSSASLQFLNAGIGANGPGQATVGGSGGDPGNGAGLGGTGVIDVAGPNATGFCAGGAGANSNLVLTDKAGGNGSIGTIIITY